jgi:hypothetical protein
MLKEDDPTWCFVAMEYHAVILDRTFLITVTASQICGARVRGLLPSPLVPDPEWRDSGLDPVKRLVERDDGVDVDSEAYVQLDRANFQIPLTEVERVRLDPRRKWGMGWVPHSGRLYLELRSGLTRELMLLGAQDGAVICERLSQAIQRARAS